MTLLDPKHLLAPFKNTVHLIAIVFVVLLFAVYRLATGGIEVVEKSDAQVAAPRAVPTLLPPNSTPIFGGPAIGGLNQLGGINPDLAKTTPAPGTNGSDLKDIEKALGLSK